MSKIKLLAVIFGLLLALSNVHVSYAGTIGVGLDCPHSKPDECVSGYSCQADPKKPGFICQPRVGVSRACDPSDPDPCITNYSCQKEVRPESFDYICQFQSKACTQQRIGCASNPRGIPGINCRGRTDTQGQCLIEDPDRDCDACPSSISPPAAPPDSFSAVFGKITPPESIKKFLGSDQTGTSAISAFLSNLIALIYAIAAVVLVFMLVWGAFDWLISEGNKEKVQAAQQKIMNAVIGIILFAVAFAVITVIGQFTGFKFFAGQGTRVITNPNAALQIQCPDGVYVSQYEVAGKPVTDPKILCKGHGY